MPAVRRSRARRAAAVLATAVTVTVAGWIPLLPSAHGSPAPTTVAREVPIARASMARSARSAGDALAVSRDGTIRAFARPATTSPQTVCSPIWFTAVALGWNQTGSVAPVDGRVAAGSSRTAFELPQVVGAEPSEGPGPTTPDYHPERQDTGLVWTGGSRCIRFTLTVPAHTALAGLHAAFVNTSGSAAGPETAPPQEPVQAAPGVSSASASEARPAWVTRAQWGADPRYFNTGTAGCSAPYYNDRVKMAFVHHTSGTNGYTAAQSDDIVRAIYWYHTQERGYCDIAYNFLIDRFGTIFVGRAGGPSRPVQPGSQMGFNPNTFSISTMGNWQEEAPPAATVASLERLLTWRLDVAHLPPLGTTSMVSEGGSTTRYPAGTRVTLPVIAGHLDTGNTDCPGALLYPRLPDIRDVVEAAGQPKLYRPGETRRVVKAGVTSTRFYATSAGPLTWHVTVSGVDGSVYASRFQYRDGLSLEWDGTDGSGSPVPPGVYRVTIQALSSNGTGSRPATLGILVDAVAPSPGPSPSGSPSPSPSAPS